MLFLFLCAFHLFNSKAVCAGSLSSFCMNADTWVSLKLYDQTQVCLWSPNTSEKTHYMLSLYYKQLPQEISAAPGKLSISLAHLQLAFHEVCKGTLVSAT